MDFAPEIRVAARALIVRGGAVLLQRNEYADGETRYTLPGGALNVGETLEQSLRRECQEELGTDIHVVALTHVFELHKPRATDPPTRRQQVEFLFRCELTQDYQPANGPKPDKHQREIAWVPVADLVEYPLFPRAWKQILSAEPGQLPLYLGLIEW